MTKKLFFPILLLSFIFISCEKEDANTPDDENISSSSLIGTWNYIAYVDDEGEELATNCEQNQTLTFEESGVFRFTYFDDFSGTCEKTQDSQGTYEFISDLVIKKDYTNEGYIDQNKFEKRFEISGNILTLFINEGEGEYQERYKK